MKTLEQYKKEQMQDSTFVKEYNAIQPEMNVIRAIVDARISQNLTQTELAEGMDMVLEVEFIPKQHI